MGWPTEELRRRFGRPENAEVIRYLEENSPSAHSDLGSLLYEAAKSLPEAGVFGPNPTACSYVFLHTPSGVACALAVGMTTLALRLDAAPEGGEPFPELGAGWFKLDPFDPARGRQATATLLRRLFQQAYRHER